MHPFFEDPKRNRFFLLRSPAPGRETKCILNSMIICTADVEGLTQSRGHLSEQPLRVPVLLSLWAVSAGPRGPRGEMVFGAEGRCRGREGRDLFGKKQLRR